MRETFTAALSSSRLLSLSSIPLRSLRAGGEGGGGERERENSRAEFCISLHTYMYVGLFGYMYKYVRLLARKQGKLSKDNTQLQ